MSTIYEKILSNTVPDKIDLTTKLVIGLTGVRRSGKSTCAKLLQTELELRGISATIVSFGDAIKKEVAATYDFPVEYCYDNEKDTREITFFMDEDHELVPPMATKVDENTFTICIRPLLQWYGTEYRRAQDPVYWIKQSLNTINYEFIDSTVVIVDDVRMKNEVEFINKFPNHLLYRINFHGTRDGSATVDKHATEKNVAKFKVDNEYSPKFGLFYLKLAVKRMIKSPELFSKLDKLS